MNGPNATSEVTKEFPSDDVYSCRSIEYFGPDYSDTMGDNDLALIRLDRDVVDLTPFPLNARWMLPLTTRS